MYALLLASYELIMLWDQEDQRSMPEIIVIVFMTEWDDHVRVDIHFYFCLSVRPPWLLKYKSFASILQIKVLIMFHFKLCLRIKWSRSLELEWFMLIVETFRHISAMFDLCSIICRKSPLRVPKLHPDKVWGNRRVLQPMLVQRNSEKQLLSLRVMHTILIAIRERITQARQNPDDVEIRNISIASNISVNLLFTLQYPWKHFIK